MDILPGDCIIIDSLKTDEVPNVFDNLKYHVYKVVGLLKEICDLFAEV